MRSSRLRRGVSLPVVLAAWPPRCAPPYPRVRVRRPHSPSWCVRTPGCAGSKRPGSSAPWRERGTHPAAVPPLPPPSGRWPAPLFAVRRRSESPCIQLRPVEGDRPRRPPDSHEIRPQGRPSHLFSTRALPNPAACRGQRRRKIGQLSQPFSKSVEKFSRQLWQPMPQLATEMGHTRQFLVFQSFKFHRISPFFLVVLLSCPSWSCLKFAASVLRNPVQSSRHTSGVASTSGPSMPSALALNVFAFAGRFLI